MANHKRKRPKNRRSGCLMCKPHKVNGFGKESGDFEQYSAHRRRIQAREEIKDYIKGKDES